MRIIAGHHRSRKLATLPGENTRPSSDKLKAALFQKLGPYFDGGRALDVFAGSGAVGLESLSRGMDHVTFVERSKAAGNIIKKNIYTLGCEKQTRLILADALVYSESCLDEFDLIFMDPPYQYENTVLIAHNLEKCVKIGGVLVIETDKYTDLPPKIGSLEKKDQRDYGIGRIHIYEMH